MSALDSSMVEMHLLDVIRRTTPEPWAEGEKIPWHEPGFSRRMLDEHMSQAHDHASRRFSIIDAHVEWIERVVVDRSGSRILEFGCGPGFYLARLAELGHSCVGVDLSPASIDYARKHAIARTLDCTYHLADIRDANLDSDFDLVMLTFGEFNVFRAADAQLILTKARRSLRTGGRLLLEVHTSDAVRQIGTSPSTWRTAERGLFSDRPHMLLHECDWDANQWVATERYYVVDAETAAVNRYAQSMQAYSDEQYRAMLNEAGFALRSISPSLSGDDAVSDFYVLVADAM